MNIVFHLGMHCTDGGLLIRSILQNRARLAEAGVSVPGPLRYRELLGEMSTRLRGEPAPPEDEADVLAAISDGQFASRAILSSENFLCRSNVAIDRNCLYPKAEKSAWLRKCLPSQKAEFAFAMRNPAGLIPDLMAGNAGTAPSGKILTEGLNLANICWSDFVRRIQNANPGCRIVTWCHEDTPFIWLDIIRELTQADPMLMLEGEFDMVESIMSPEGFKRLTEFFETKDVRNRQRRQKTLSAFLGAHADENEIMAEVDLPGWDDLTVDALTEFYEQDVEEVAAMPGVTCLMP